MESVNYYSLTKHRRWRKAVLRRAKYKCQDCARFGKSTLATIAHHDQPREFYPERQYDIDNGVALCMPCHNKRHPEKGKGNRNPPHP